MLAVDYFDDLQLLSEGSRVSRNVQTKNCNDTRVLRMRLR